MPWRQRFQRRQHHSVASGRAAPHRLCPECDRLAESVPDSGGVVVVPAFTGLGAPYWDMYARGAILGITRGTGRAHVARAVLECIAYQVTDLMLAMRQDAGCDITACGWTAGPACRISSCSCRRTCCASPWTGRRWWRPPPSVRRLWRAQLRRVERPGGADPPAPEPAGVPAHAAPGGLRPGLPPVEAGRVPRIRLD